MRILIAGGTGFVGQNLRRHFLSQYAEVHILSTNPNLVNGMNIFYWNPRKRIYQGPVHKSYDCIVNLAGANIAEKFWTAKRKQEILDSRIQSCEFISELLDNSRLRTGFLLQASAIGIYGDSEYIAIEENVKDNKNFMSYVCVEWEKAANKIQVPKAIFRIGIVFHKSQGAFPKLVMSVKYRICLLLGDGKNFLSWIDVDDLCRMMIHAISHKMEGIYNAVSPEPIQNIKLLKEYKKKFGGLSMTLVVPRFILKVLLGDFSSLFLFSQNVSSAKIQQTGFEFQVPTLKRFLKKIKH